MCSRIANAQSNTHAILTATIADSPTGGPGSLVVQSTPTPTSPPTQTPSNTGSGTTTTDGEATPKPAPAASASLTPAQIAGIVVGSVGAILIAIVAILIIRRIRKRRYPGLEGGFSPMSDGRSRSAGSGSKKLLISAPVRKLSSDGGSLAQMPQSFRTPPTYFPTPPMKPPRTPPIPPGASSNFFLTPNSSMEAVGLAISRSLNTTPSISPETPVQRHQSKLLPAKPDIGSDVGLRVPPPRPLPPPPPPPPEPVSEPEPVLTRGPSSRTAHTNRTSLLTNMTAFADLDAEAAEGTQTWRPRPSDPSAASPLYVADKYGNWVLNNNNRQSDLAQVTEAAELDAYTPLTKSPQERKEEVAAITEAISAASAVPEKPQPAFLAEDPSANPITLHRSSSVYSQASAIRRSSRFLGWRSNSTKSKKGSPVKVTRSDTVKSQDSVTTINTSTSSPIDGELPFELENARLSQLTSVIESAVGTPTPGRSPVKYPKIPGRLNKTVLQVDLAKRIEFGIYPPGQPSPTIKGAAAPATSPYPKPLSIKRSKSSETLKSVKSIKSAINDEPVPDLPPPPQLNNNKPLIQSPVSRFSPRVPNIEAWPSNPNVPERVQTPPMQTPRSIVSPNLTNADAFLMPSPVSTRSGGGEARPHIARAVSPLSMVTMTSGSGAQTALAAHGASSLLAKRLGNGKAAALSLSPDSRKKRLWKKQGSNLSPFDAGLASPKGSLPATPTWQPKLTPTRKGDDLVLNVQ